jgi:hypothetical protein
MNKTAFLPGPQDLCHRHNTNQRLMLRINSFQFHSLSELKMAHFISRNLSEFTFNDTPYQYCGIGGVLSRILHKNRDEK